MKSELIKTIRKILLRLQNELSEVKFEEDLKKQNTSIHQNKVCE